MNFDDCLKDLSLLIENYSELFRDNEIIIWGVCQRGHFLKYLLEKVFPNRITMIDQAVHIPIETIAVKRSTYLNYVDSKKVVILSVVRDFNSVLEIAVRYGYKKSINIFDIGTSIGANYVEYIEKYDFWRTQGGQFYPIFKDYGCDYFKGDNNESTPVNCVSLSKVINHVTLKYNVDNFFDYGCGKGQAILYAYANGIKKLGGIEYENDIYKQCKKNLSILGLKAIIIKGDAGEYTGIDDFNCFFFYNPFVGETFYNSIKRIEESLERKNRRVIIIYGNPFCHESVIKDGIFKLIEQRTVLLYDPLLNIYSNVV